jgi:CheY-like chemotaxis protein/anti-sigma regulatory factor (Ser/Thr protein kinase)
MTVATAAETTPAGAAKTVLVVDDSPMDRVLAGGLIQQRPGWRAVYASDGNEALTILAREKPDVVLTDLQMPEMDGLELVQAIRSQFPLLPVILMTGQGSEDIAIRALQGGAASYVPKRSLANNLAETLDQVLTVARSDRDQRRLVECQMQWQAEFVLENDPSMVPPLVSYLEDGITRMRICEPSGLILLGVALHEALTNAIYHGNLEVDSALREQEERRYYSLADERRKKSPWRDRRVHVLARISRLEAVFTIRDEGTGFDPSTLPDPTDPTNLERVSGRGLLLIQTFMDEVEHNEAGNQITLTKRSYQRV